MEIRPADFFQTLGHPQRIEVFRLLVRRYPDALAAGEIALALDLKPSTLSVYLGALLRAGLLKQERQGTSLLYQARIDTMQDALAFLIDDCCKGRTELCAPALEAQPQAQLNVLFLCTANSARSFFAEAILHRFAGGSFAAFSAGTHPAIQPNKKAIEVLLAKGYDTAPLQSKSTAELLAKEAPKMDFVFTLCDQAANEDCSVWHGAPITSHWGLPDPAGVRGSDADISGAFHSAFETIYQRVHRFVALPFETLDRASRQRAVDTIARL
jgi:ArsR family transcriptional regulator, arsenate/arsenite/antimonite-responsive transcriptional repressor / arsenate reductase (thioredoxin)